MRPVAVHDTILVREIGDELIIYDRRSDTAHRLNATAALVWRHCDGQHTVADLANVLAESGSHASPDQIVSLALEYLREAQLLEQSGTSPVRPVSRREAVRRLGKVAGTALVLPVVTSIAAPVPADAQSGVKKPGKPPKPKPPKPPKPKPSKPKPSKPKPKH